MDLRNGDCLELMKTIPDKSVDLLLCDLPYGETNCKWDTKIDMEEFWKEFKRIRKSPKVACIHFCSTKFGYTLIKSWEKGYKMDLVFKKRNKTGGLQSRYRPMRNHEMIYFFYDQAPKYNRDKYHKRIQQKVEVLNNTKGNITNAGHKEGAQNFDKCNYFEPPNPASVVEEEKPKKKSDKQKSTKKYLEQGGHSEMSKYNASDRTSGKFVPTQPGSVIEEKEEEKCLYGFNKKDKQDYKVKDLGKNHNFEPPNPASVVEEQTIYGQDKKKTHPTGNGLLFEPPNPASVVEDTDIYGEKASDRHERYLECGCGYYEPPNPASVVESTKVFIGKRNHQTEKPQDVLEFLIKYWTNEDDVVLDPTMGSGSTGVACQTLKRKFIGFELDPKIYEVAVKRINKI